MSRASAETYYLPQIECQESFSRHSLSAWIDSLQLWHDRSRERRHLLSLDNRMLGDIGISRADAVKESGKSFWQD